MWKGGGKGEKNAVMVTLGTGVGGGVIIGGKVVVGTHGAGGEIGHLCVNYEETEVCGCGNKGCLEQYASATGIVRLAKKKLEYETRKSALTAESVTAKDVFDAVKAGDVVAREVAEEFGRYLGYCLANLAASQIRRSLSLAAVFPKQERYCFRLFRNRFRRELSLQTGMCSLNWLHWGMTPESAARQSWFWTNADKCSYT